MEKNCYVYEGVSYGHPDKLADIIADALVDEFLKQDKNSRCGIEVMVKDNVVILGGEVNSNANVDYETIVRNVFDEIRYPENHHLTSQEIKITNLIGLQSTEISKGVDKENNDEIGAGDQGVVFGYADDSTLELMPLGNQLARDLWKAIIKVDGLGPDIKTQVTVDETSYEIKEIVVSTMHQISLEETREIINDIVNRTIELNYPSHKFDNYKQVINLNGEWRIGGSVSDCGITGRKLAVDFYGSSCPIGGGNLSGKDLSKVDRSGAYMARYLAKNIVASGLARKVKIQLGYIISKPTPCNINIEMEGKKCSQDDIINWITDNVDLTVKGMVEKFGDVSFKNTSKNGHFGNIDYPWEKLELVENIREDLGLS